VGFFGAIPLIFSLAVDNAEKWRLISAEKDHGT